MVPGARVLLFGLWVDTWAHQSVVNASLAWVASGLPVGEEPIGVMRDAIGNEVGRGALVASGVEVAHDDEVLTDVP